MLEDGQSSNARDVNCTGSVDAADTADTPLLINSTLGLDVVWDCDLDLNGSVNAVDTQLVISTALGIGSF